MDKNLKKKLSLMMFLEFFVWGAWAVTLGTYLGSTLNFEGTQIGALYGTTAIAAILSPILVGLIADRHFASQKVFSALHFAGALLLLVASHITDFGTLYFVLLAYALCYMPTLALANGIGFRHLENPDEEFPLVRVFGTLGWIVAGLTIGFLKIEDTSIPLLVASGVSVLLGIFGLLLPNTPPTKKYKQSFVQMLGLDAFLLLRERSFLVLFICSVLISIPLAFYYNFTNLFLNEIGIENAAGKMTMGQTSEVIFLLLMPFLFRKLGVKWMMAIGMAAWVARYLLFALSVDQTAVWMLYGGIILHGICYDFFFVTGQIYANQRAPDELKNSIQGLMTLGTYGIGMLIGSVISGWTVTKFTGDDAQKAWDLIWLAPAAMAFLVLVLFLIFFKQPDSTQTTDN